MYPWFTMSGDFNPCYLYMQELKSCFEEKIYPMTNCKNEREDFLECHNRQKHTQALSDSKRALDLSTGINVPHYDAPTDSFIYDDGKVISNEDPIFKTYKWF